jgi:MFS transporter, PAT family, solute carrier family 33 (acetyl-CoA transportor), member 1
VKILWAPIVDCFYSKTFGRRKTWLIPSQLLIGTSLLFLSGKVDNWFGDGATQKPQVLLITIVFSLVWFLTATQDIAVDGWAITMLKRRNVGFAATVNFVGQSFGSLLGFIVFLSLESKAFCNKYIFSEPRDEGLLKLSGFLMFWGIAFLTVTIAIAIFKRETPVDETLFPNHGVKKAYPTLWKILKLKPMLKLATIFSTEDFSFAACELLTTLKLIDSGMSKDSIALFNVPSFVVQLLIPILISKYVAGRVENISSLTKRILFKMINIIGTFLLIV